AFETRLRRRGPDSRAATFCATPVAPRKALRMSLPKAQEAAAFSRLKPGAALTITGRPLGMATTREVGMATGSAHESARSPMRMEREPPKVILRAPIRNDASPPGGLT